MGGMQAAKIVGIKGLGTTTDDEMAFVQCELQDGSVYALSFAYELATPLTTAFLSAAGHLRMKREMRGLSTDDRIHGRRSQGHNESG